MKKKFETLVWSNCIMYELKVLIANIIEAIKAISFPEGHVVLRVLPQIETSLNNLVIATEKIDNDSRKEEFDDVRDELFNYIKEIIKTNLESRRQNRKEAAEMLYETFTKVDKNLENLKYSSESEQLELLFARWDTPEALAALTTLHLDEDYAELKEAEQAFTEVAKDFAESKQVGSRESHKYRAQVIEEVRELLSLLKALANLDNDEECALAIDATNQFISHQDTANKVRIAQAKKDKLKKEGMGTE